MYGSEEFLVLEEPLSRSGADVSLLFVPPEVWPLIEADFRKLKQDSMRKKTFRKQQREKFES